MARKRSNKALKPPSFAAIISGATRVDLATLVGAIHRANPSGRDLGPVHLKQRYELKNQLQSKLILEHSDRLVAHRDSGDPDVVGLKVTGLSIDACHTRISELDDAAASRLRFILDAQAAEADTSERHDDDDAPGFAIDDQTPPASALERGRAALAAYDLVEARVCFEAALTNSRGGPQEADALLELLVETLGDWEAALSIEPRLNAEALSLDRVRLRLALAAAHVGHPEAERWMAALRGLHRSQVASALTQQALKRGDVFEARRLLPAALKGAPRTTQLLALQDEVTALVEAKTEALVKSTEEALEAGTPKEIEAAAGELAAWMPTHPLVPQARNTAEARRRESKAAECLAEGEAALYDGRPAQALELLRRARKLGISDDNLNALISLAQKERKEEQARLARDAARTHLLEGGSEGIIAWAGLRESDRAELRAEIAQSTAHHPELGADLDDIAQQLPLPIQGRRLAAMASALMELRTAASEVEMGHWARGMERVRRAPLLAKVQRAQALLARAETAIKDEQVQRSRAAFDILKSGLAADAPLNELEEQRELIRPEHLLDEQGAVFTEMLIALDARLEVHRRHQQAKKLLTAERYVDARNALLDSSGVASENQRGELAALRERAQVGIRTRHRPTVVEPAEGARLIDLRLMDGRDRSCIAPFGEDRLIAGWSYDREVFAAHVSPSGHILRACAVHLGAHGLPGQGPSAGIRGVQVRRDELWLLGTGATVVLDAESLELKSIHERSVKDFGQAIRQIWLSEDGRYQWQLREDMQGLGSVLILDASKGRRLVQIPMVKSFTPVRWLGQEAVLLTTDVTAAVVSPAGKELCNVAIPPGDGDDSPATISAACLHPRGIQLFIQEPSGLLTGVYSEEDGFTGLGASLGPPLSRRIECVTLGNRVFFVREGIRETPVGILSINEDGFTPDTGIRCHGATLIADHDSVWLSLPNPGGFRFQRLNDYKSGFKGALRAPMEIPEVRKVKPIMAINTFRPEILDTWTPTKPKQVEPPEKAQLRKKLLDAAYHWRAGATFRTRLAIKRAGLIDPDHPATLMLLAEEELEAGKVEKAASIMERATLDDVPMTLVPAWAWMLARVQLAQGKHDLASKSLGLVGRLLDELSALHWLMRVETWPPPGLSAEPSTDTERFVRRVCKAIDHIAQGEPEDAVQVLQDIGLYELEEAHARRALAVAWLGMEPTDPWGNWCQRRAIAAALDVRRRGLKVPPVMRYERLPIPVLQLPNDVHETHSWLLDGSNAAARTFGTPS